MRKTLALLKKTAFHPNPNIRLVVSLVYTALGLFCNFYLLQVFCMPIWWAAIWASVAFITVIFFPFIKNHTLRKVGYFILGLAVPVYLYLIIFLADPWEGFNGYIVFSILILFFGIGLLAFIPFYFLHHTFQYVRQSTIVEKRIFAAGIIIPLIALVVFSIQFKARYDDIYNSFSSSKVFNLSIAQNAKKDYFTERMLGIGFLYHTKLDYIYDGARPPLHDPFLNVCLWLNNKNVNCGYLGLPIPLNLKQQYSHFIFPANPMKASCPCSYTKDGLSYFRE